MIVVMGPGQALRSSTTQQPQRRLTDEYRAHPPEPPGEERLDRRDGLFRRLLLDPLFILELCVGHDVQLL